MNHTQYGVTTPPTYHTGEFKVTIQCRDANLSPALWEVSVDVNTHTGIRSPALRPNRPTVFPPKSIVGPRILKTNGYIW